MKILVLDIETTGFDHFDDDIVELGMVSLDLETGAIEDLYDQMFKTEDHKSDAWIFQKGYMAFTETTNKPFFFYREREIQAVVDQYLGRVTAWNREFDFGFLEYNKISLGKPLPCPMLESTDYFAIETEWGYKWPKAQEAWDNLFPDNPFTEEHRGLSDARMEAQIIYELYQRGVYRIPTSCESA